jgi:hypothetical protein
MATNFYTGQNQQTTVNHVATDGTPIPHADIEDVRYVLRHASGQVLGKWALSAPSGWDAVTATAIPGQFTFNILESQGKTWPTGRVYMEWHITLNLGSIPEGFKPMGELHLFDVFTTAYSKQ